MKKIRIFLLTGCTIQNVNENVETISIEDCVGRRVQIPAKIDRIAALDSFSAEALVMTEAADKMVCCPRGVKSDEILQKIDSGLSEKAVVQSGGSINAEALLKLNPDVILIKNGLY